MSERGWASRRQPKAERNSRWTGWIARVDTRCPDSLRGRLRARGRGIRALRRPSRPTGARRRLRPPVGCASLALPSFRTGPREAGCELAREQRRVRVPAGSDGSGSRRLPGSPPRSGHSVRGERLIIRCPRQKHFSCSHRPGVAESSCCLRCAPPRPKRVAASPRRPTAVNRARAVRRARAVWRASASRPR